MDATEDFIQQQVYMWFNNMYCLKSHNPRYVIFAVPNGGKRDAREAKKLKNTGLLKGASDLVIILENETVYSETKKPTGYYGQTDEQKDFQLRVENLGHKYIIYKTLEEFKLLITPIIEENVKRNNNY